MKNSLLLPFTVVSTLLLYTGIQIKAQTVVFSEDFSGFSVGTHTTPSTSDASATLDSKTHLPGWTGSKVYPAGGEIKLGTSTVTGWLETPSISFTGYEGNLTLKFDICRWTGDATSVQILLNGSQIGNTLAPTDNFQTIEIPVTAGVSSGKIKFEALSKRFFLDNVLVVSQGVTSADHFLREPEEVVIFPNPVVDFVTVKYAGGYDILTISDISGRRYLTMKLDGSGMTEICLAGFPSGIYFIRLDSGKKHYTGRIIK